MSALTAFLWAFLSGVYLGLGLAIGTWHILDDDPLYPDDPLALEVVQGVIIAFAWGPVLIFVAVDEVLRL